MKKRKHEMPQKRHYRQRAHANPLSFNDSFVYPRDPTAFRNEIDGTYVNETDAEQEAARVTFLDVGCGFGGLLVGLSPLFPKERILGMEIRAKVTEYVRKRILALRDEHPGTYGNLWVLRTNAMRYLPNYVERGQLKKMFFCFPDPHFKKKNYRRRIINQALLGEYAFALRPGGKLYTISDVFDLHKWMDDHLARHPCFEKVSDAENEADPAVRVVRCDTEEGKKVERNSGEKFLAVYRRIEDAAVPLPQWAK